MTPLRLRAIHPNWLRVVDLHHKLHGPRPRRERLKPGEEAAGERVAWVGEGGLHDGVVFGEVAEGQGVAGHGFDGGGVKGEFGVGADSDGNVGGEGEGE